MNQRNNRNAAYWAKRFRQIEESQNSMAQDVYDQVEPMFRRSQKEMQTEIESWYQRLAANNEISMAEAKRLLNTKELAEFKWTVEDYISRGQQNALDGKWVKELENASARYHISRLEALKIQTQQSLEIAFGNQLDGMEHLVGKLYTEGYYRTVYEVQKGFQIGWEITSVDNRLDTLLKKPWGMDERNFSQRLWGHKEQLVNNVHREMVQMCLLGRGPEEAINNIAKAMNRTKNHAQALVMTESAYFTSNAQKEAFKELDVEQYRIVATLDNDTSEICQEMDGRVFDLKDDLPGVTSPPFHVHCRSTKAPHFKDDTGTRAARGEDGKIYYIPSNITYKEWRERFVKG